MRNKRSITAAVVLFLGLSAVAWGQPGYRYDNRYPDRRGPGSYGGYGNNLVGLAYQVEATSVSVYRQFERNNRRPNRDEARVSANLYRMAQEANHFRAQVSSYRQDPRHTQQDFQDLLGAFDRAAWSLRSVRNRPYVDQGMDRIWALLSSLNRYYGYDNRHGGFDRGWRDRGDGRYDRNDRDDDGRYDRDRDGDRDDDGRYDRGHNDDDGYRPPQM